MSIDLRFIEQEVKKEYDHLGFETVDEGEGDTLSRLKLRANIVSPENFDDNVALDFVVYNDGFIILEFVFDELDKNFENYDLINDFNEATIFKGYIRDSKNGSKYFVVEQTNFAHDTQHALDFINYSVNRLLEEDVLKYLKPIALITK